MLFIKSVPQCTETQTTRQGGIIQPADKAGVVAELSSRNHLSAQKGGWSGQHMADTTRNATQTGDMLLPAHQLLVKDCFQLQLP